MNTDWLTAIGTVGTLVVITASAIAALIQLRHMRSGNQIAAYNECRETMETPEFREALGFIQLELPSRLRDPAVCEEVVRNGLRDQYAGVRLVANLFESMGLFVKIGMMEEDIACELWSAIVLETWKNLRPLIAVVRKVRAPGIWINFEYMAFLSQRYIERHPVGEYPAGAQRMPLDA